MKKRLFSVALATAMAFSVAACGSNETATTTAAPAGDTEAAADAADTTEAAEASTSAEGKRIGICMPTQSAERWINDAANMKKLLEEKGYTVDVQFAEDDPQAQVTQVGTF